MNYLELKQSHQKRINSLPIKFAFSDEQFVKAMAELGLKPDETDQVRRVFRDGFCHKDSVKLIVDTLNETEAEMEKPCRTMNSVSMPSNTNLRIMSIVIRTNPTTRLKRSA